MLPFELHSSWGIGGYSTLDPFGHPLPASTTPMVATRGQAGNESAIQAIAVYWYNIGIAVKERPIIGRLPRGTHGAPSLKGCTANVRDLGKQQMNIPLPRSLACVSAFFLFFLGPETVESLISGPQSIKTEASIKTEGSIKTEASTKTESSKAGTANGSGKPSSSRSASLHGFLLSDSPKQAANCNGSGSGGSGGAASASFPAPSAISQKQRESSDHGGDCADKASSEPSLPAEGDDPESALSGALCAPRRKAAPPDTSVSNESPGDAAPAVSVADKKGPGNGLAFNSVEVVAEGKGEEWGGLTEGMFRKRISFELKAMLTKNGGVCKMVSLAGTYKRHRHRTLNLLGKKVCFLCVLIHAQTGILHRT